MRLLSVGKDAGKMTDLGTDYLDDKKKKSLKHIADLSNEAQIKEEEEKKKEYYVQKFKGNEAILIGGLPYFLEIVDDRVILHNQIVLPDMILKPYDRIMYQNKEYSFNSLDEIEEYVIKAKQETFDTLYLKIKDIWTRYIDADNDHLTICAADTIFTYFQDKLGMTHYLLFVGDNGSGKSNNLKVFQYLAYRALFDTSITAANIYQFLGSIEEGQGIILEDEADSIDQDIHKMKIYKVGYQSGTKVSRLDLSSGRKQEGYWTYCFKAYSTERQLNSTKAKGFMERVFVLSCSTGNPRYDITEIINPAGDNKQIELLEDLNNIRKLLLVFRLVKQSEPILDIKLNIKNRDKQLCKPLLRLFHNSQIISEISSTLSKLLAEKRQRKSDTLDARLFEIVVNLIGHEGTSILSNKIIWESVKANIEGHYDPNKPLSYETEEYYTISQKKVSDILESKFGAKKTHIGHEWSRALQFDQDVLKRLEVNYSKTEQIRIINDADTSDASDGSIGGKDGIKGEKIEIIEHEITDLETLKPTENTGISPNDLSDPSATKPRPQATCPKCGYTDEAFYMKIHQCEGTD